MLIHHRVYMLLLLIALLGKLEGFWIALARLSMTGMYVKVMWTNLIEKPRRIWCPTDARKLHKLYLLQKTTRVLFLIGLLREWSICAAYIYCHKSLPCHEVSDIIW